MDTQYLQNNINWSTCNSKVSPINFQSDKFLASLSSEYKSNNFICIETFQMSFYVDFVITVIDIKLFLIIALRSNIMSLSLA